MSKDSEHRIFATLTEDDVELLRRWYGRYKGEGFAGAEDLELIVRLVGDAYPCERCARSVDVEELDPYDLCWACEAVWRYHHPDAPW